MPLPGNQLLQSPAGAGSGRLGRCLVRCYIKNSQKDEYLYGVLNETKSICKKIFRDVCNFSRRI